MLYGLYLSTAGMMVQRHQHDVIANNLANAATTSFKRDVAVFRARPPESQVAPSAFRYRHPVLDRLGGGTLLGPSCTEFKEGEIEATGRPLDVCIRGPGFFAVRDPDGRICYTRDGRFAVSQSGDLTMLDGQRVVLDPSHQPIQVDPSRPVAVGGDGTVTQGGQAVATIALADFADPQALRKVGGNLYAAPLGADRPRPASLLAGHLERSTVDPVKELVAMIEAQRAYEANAQMIRLQDETLGRVVNDLARNI